MSTTSIPSNIIKINKASHTLETPIIILKNRNFNVIGEIKHFTNWNISFQAVGIDEISFDVYKELNDEECDVWDKLIDLAIIEVKGYGHFEISVTINEANEVIKSVVGQSLEVELGQITLHEFHVNDDDATTMEETEYNEDDFDDEGNFIPTVFCNFDDEKHSLLHRVLADKAPHWSIGYVPTYISINKTDKPELASAFQRTYTVDGTSIYDFLMNDVAEESNVFFIFDTYNRKINCYNAEDLVWTDGTEVISINAYGEDTTIFVDMDNLANQITLSGDKDSVKNCFRVSGGDDVITDFVRVANITGDNYIWLFSQAQLDDMPTDLSESILDYQEFINSDKIQDAYYGENGIFTRLCAAYDKYYLLESELMPQVSLEVTTADEQYYNVVNGFKSMDIGVYSYDNYDDNLFIGVTNNVMAMAQIFVDSRYEVDVIDGSTSYDSKNHIWKGRIKVYRNADETDSYSSPNNEYLNVQITVDTDDELPYTKQKIMKALASGDIEEMDFNITTTSTDAEKEAEINRIYNYLDENYCRVRLQSFDDAYDTCITILSDLKSKNDSIVAENLYYKYYTISSIVKSVLDKRTKEVEAQRVLISDIELEQEEFQETVNFENYLINRFYDSFKEEIGDEIDEETDEEKALIATKEYVQELYKIFCMYRREDEYQNDNYISDGKTDSEIIEIAKELLTVAKEEVKKACLLQRTISTDLNNLLVMEEFEPFYDKFALFNYIRVETNNELFKLRLMGIDYDSNSPEKINVTFSENIESINGTVSDLQSMYDAVATISSSYSSTMLQAKSGKIASNEVANLYNNGLNAALMKVTSSNNNEVTLGAYGLLCKEMTDEGVYSLNQVRLIGKGLYMTTDGWQTVRACLGETEDGVYGLIADQIVGTLFAGEKLLITNESDSVKITGNGIVIENGTITWNNVNSPEMSNINGLNAELNKLNQYCSDNASNLNAYKTEISKFQTQVNNSLSVLNNAIPTTIIGSDYVISPKIGGGYLYIANSDTGISVEINPMGTSFSGHNSNYVFNIAKNNSIIMGVTNTGSGEFSGNLTSSSIYLNSNSETNRGCIKLGNLIENDGDVYKKISIINDYASDTDNLAIAFSFKNTDTTNFYATAGMAIIKKNGSIYNQLYSNTYLGDESSFIGKSSSTYNGLYASNAIKTPRVYAGNYVHGDYALDVNGESYFSNKINFHSGYYLNSLHDSSGTQLGIYCSGQFNTAENMKLCVGNVDYSNSNTWNMLNVSGNGWFNGDIYCNSPNSDMVHVIVQNGTHKGALAVNGTSFGLWDFTYNTWMIHVDGNGAVTVKTTMSDRRMKKNIKETSVNNALEQILKIKHKEFDFKIGNRHKDTGYIAQELEEINPLMVNKPEPEDDVYLVDSFYLEAIITKAIQEFYKKYTDDIKEIKEMIANM